MNDVDLESTLTPRVMTMRIIVIALLTGIFLFIGIAVYTRTMGQMAPPPDVPILSYIAFIAAAPMLLAALVVPRLIESAAIRRIAKDSATARVGQLLPIYQQRLIIRSALFEGPAFFALVAFMVEGQWAMLAIAAVMAAGIATGFPSVAGVQTWLEDRQERIAAQRAGDGVAGTPP
jgi:hypothetical protein